MKNDWLIRSQFCTCHDSWAVVTCANMWPDLAITIKIRGKKNFHKIWIMRSWILSGTDPCYRHSKGQAILCCKGNGFYCCLSKGLAQSFQSSEPSGAKEKMSRINGQSLYACFSWTLSLQMYKELKLAHSVNIKTGNEFCKVLNYQWFCLLFHCMPMGSPSTSIKYLLHPLSLVTIEWDIGLVSDKRDKIE